MNRTIRTYKSELGHIGLSISSKQYEFDIAQLRIGKVDILTLNYRDGTITVKQFKFSNLPNSDYEVEKAVGWSILIQSIRDNKGQLIFQCRFDESLKGDISTGEHLDGLQFKKSDNYDLHIGTEDAESFMWRAAAENFMPKRFFWLLRNEYKDYADKHFTSYLDDGFQTKLPPLLEGEVVKFHFIIAESELQEKNDIRTWLTVEKRIEEVEQIIESKMMA